jgi:hypothetical protein
MSLRMQLYDFCVKHANDIDSSLCDPVYKFRLNYCLMFTAFEIKNDMKASVHYFEKLDLELLKQTGPLLLHWISDSYTLDYDLIRVFGE